MLGQSAVVRREATPRFSCSCVRVSPSPFVSCGRLQAARLICSRPRSLTRGPGPMRQRRLHCKTVQLYLKARGTQTHLQRGAVGGAAKRKCERRAVSAAKNSPEMGSAPRRQASPATAVARPFVLLFATALFCRAAAYGGYAEGMTDLQKHAAFFDGNGDGIVSISETYDAFRALGFGVGMSSVSAAFINGALASKTRPENATSSHLDIYIENIHKGIHGSDSGAYDAQGRFVPEKFDEIFARHAKNVPDALTSDGIDELLQADRQPSDYQGWVGATSEWKILYSLAKDKDGLLRKDVARGVYDGSLFHQLVQKKRSGDK